MIDDVYIKMLREKDHVESLRYYEAGASDGNIFSMRMLAKFYVSGQRCEVDTYKAIFWLTKAANSGDELAKKELLTFLNKDEMKKTNWLQRFWKK